MFQITSVPTRYFEMKAPDNHRVLHIEPPKLKRLNQLRKWGKAQDPSVSEAAEIVAQIISKNKEGRKVTADMVMEWMNADQLAAFIGAFMGWLNKTKEEYPN